jgi:hypothetical protein
LETGSIGHNEARLRELEGRQLERLLLDRQRVAGLGDGQLRDRTDLAGLQLADRLLFLAVEQEQLPMRSSSSRVLFQRCACEWSVPDRTRR